MTSCDVIIKDIRVSAGVRVAFGVRYNIQYFEVILC